MTTHTCPDGMTPIDSIGGPVCVADQWLTPDHQDPAECTNGYYQGSCLPPRPTTTTTETPDTNPPAEQECYVYVGGNHCWPTGSPEAAAAIEADLPTITTTTTASMTATASVTAERTTPTTEAHETVGTPPPTPPVTVLPATGLDAALLAAATITVAVGATIARLARRT